jgi:hypothetical protein
MGAILRLDPMRNMFPVLMALFALPLIPRVSPAQLAPTGRINVEQPGGVHYLFGSGGMQTGGGFFYLNYLTGEFDVVGPVSVLSTGSFSGVSPLTGRSISGQISKSSISLTYNGVTVSSGKKSAYGPAAAFAGVYSGAVTEPTLGVFSGEIVNNSDGTSLLFAIGNSGVSFGVGSIDSGGHISITTLLGEVITTTFAPKNGVAQGTAQSSFGYQYTYSATRAVPPRLANISTRGFIGAGEQVLIGGFIIKDGGETVVMNAKGPSLASLGVTSPIQNPRLDLYYNGQIIASNGDWHSNTNASEISLSGLAPTDDREASLQVALEPGAYTVIVSTEDGSQGIGLVEVYGIL